MPDQNWQFELEEYIKQGEPDRAEKSEAWQTAIGLQAVDGLNTSAYLLDTAKDHIEGKITIDEAQQRIHSYYEQRTTRTEIENETKEADIVSARIAKLLGEKTFQFSPAEWITIHRRLFEGVFDHAGQIRKYSISKKEKLVAIGELLGFDSRSEVKITTGAVVDAVWEAKIGNMGKAIYVFEVQSKGSIDSLILNLKKAQSNAAVQAVVAVADEEQLAKISLITDPVTHTLILFIFCTHFIWSADLSCSVTPSFSAYSFTSREKRACASSSTSARWECSLPEVSRL